MDKETILSHLDIESFLKREIPSMKWNKSDWGQGLCFKHDDKNPSLFANRSTGQLHCKGCNYRASLFDFYMERHNVDFQTALRDLAKEVGLSTEPQRKITKIYNYTDESGNILFQTVRYEPKDFAQRRPDPKNNGNWIWNLEGIQFVPYNFPEVLKAEDVIIVEGEKDADSLNAIGFTTTCNPMGAGRWKPEYNQHFKDKRIVIITDNDEPGRKHASQVVKNLKGMTESVKIIELPDIPDKGDVSDWIAQGGTKEKLIEIIKATPEWEEPKENYSLSFLKKGSELINLECKVEWVVDKLIPKQSITLLHGKGGIGKTWISLILGNAVSKGIGFMDLSTQVMPVIFTDFENSLPVLVERVKKIEASEVLFWHNTNEKRPPKLDREDWEQYKSLPVGLLIFDTLRASQSKDENDSKDMAFIMSRLKELRDMGFTILLLHHTPKSNDRTYKGSTAIMDLADHVLSLHKVKKGSLEDADDDDEEGYYRLGTKEKTRYEPFHIFLDFDHEKGFVIAPDPDEEDIKKIHYIITELKDSIGELPIQSRITEKVKEELELSNSKIARLLRNGEGKYWNSKKLPKRNNAKVFEPISVFQFSNTIYSRETGKHPETVNQFSSNNLPDDNQRSLDNPEFATFPEGVQKTEKQEVIVIEGEL
jgi:archaellum biogenesis ATPase FlaH